MVDTPSFRGICFGVWGNLIYQTLLLFGVVWPFTRDCTCSISCVLNTYVLLMLAFVPVLWANSEVACINPFGAYFHAHTSLTCAPDRPGIHPCWCRYLATRSSSYPCLLHVFFSLAAPSFDVAATCPIQPAWGDWAWLHHRNHPTYSQDQRSLTPRETTSGSRADDESW